MKKFQYQTLRYMPDRLSGEFVNLGVVLLVLEPQDLYFRFYNRTGRLHNFFPGVNSLFVKQTINKIEAGLLKLKESFLTPLFTERVNNLEGLTAQVLAKDDSSLFFSEVKMVLDVEGEILLHELFERLITRHVIDEDRTSIQDSEVWTKIYKPYFEKASFALDLKETTVKTKHDELHFEKTCRNGTLHCFEPVSFQLTSADVVRRKVYTWAGRLQELETSKEPLHVYLLAAMPSDPKLKTLLKDKFSNKRIGQTTIELVDEKHVEQTVRKVEKLMEEHEH
jgi:hypothetical protein